MTQLVYDARENALEHIHREATELQADGVIGIKMFIYEIGSGIVEVMAIGTAIKRSTGVTTQTEQLPPQAIIRDRDTFFDQTHSDARNLGRETTGMVTKGLEIAGSFGRISARRDPWFTKLYKTLHFSSANAHNGRPAASRLGETIRVFDLSQFRDKTGSPRSLWQVF